MKILLNRSTKIIGTWIHNKHSLHTRPRRHFIASFPISIETLAHFLLPKWIFFHKKREKTARRRQTYTVIDFFSSSLPCRVTQSKAPAKKNLQQTGFGCCCSELQNSTAAHLTSPPFKHTNSTNFTHEQWFSQLDGMLCCWLLCVFFLIRFDGGWKVVWCCWECKLHRIRIRK